MTDRSRNTMAQVDAPPLAPVQKAIDVEHLARMTLGDRPLERDVLELFERQATLLLEQMRDAQPEAVLSMAHTLKGSARGVGAWKIAGAAEQVEHAAGAAHADLPHSVAQLAKTIDEARLYIAEVLRAD